MGSAFETRLELARGVTSERPEALGVRVALGDAWK